MNKNQVPHFESALSKKNIKEVNYALDENGNYTTELSEGWEPKSLALDFTLEDIQERIIDAKNKIIEGKSSPILYYMELNRMDIQTLSAYMNQWIITTKLHSKPFFFNKLSEKKLQDYTSVFEISVSKLKNAVEK